MPGRSRRASSAAGSKACSGSRSDAAQLTGILNGIDESWDPRVCAQLAQPFGAGDWEGKQANADYVRKQFGLALSRGPIFGLVARLVHQKGVDLVLSAADEIIEAGGQIVVTGSGEPRDRAGAGRCAPPQAGRDRRRHRLQRRPGAADFCRQRFHADAVAVRAVRAEPDVCAAVRIAADRSPDRRTGGNHHRTAKPDSCSRNRRRNPSSAASGARSRPSGPRTASTRCGAARWRDPSAGIFRPPVTARCIEDDRAFHQCAILTLVGSSSPRRFRVASPA